MFGGVNFPQPPPPTWFDRTQICVQGESSASAIDRIVGRRSQRSNPFTKREKRKSSEVLRFVNGRSKVRFELSEITRDGNTMLPSVPMRKPDYVNWKIRSQSNLNPMIEQVVQPIRDCNRKINSILFTSKCIKLVFYWTYFKMFSFFAINFKYRFLGSSVLFLILNIGFHFFFRFVFKFWKLIFLFFSFECWFGIFRFRC